MLEFEVLTAVTEEYYSLGCNTGYQKFASVLEEYTSSIFRVEE
jgi:hypothetical protein